MKTSAPPARAILAAIVVALLLAVGAVYIFAGRTAQPVENSLPGEELPTP